MIHKDGWEPSEWIIISRERWDSKRLPDIFKENIDNLYCSRRERNSLLLRKFNFDIFWYLKLNSVWWDSKAGSSRAVHEEGLRRGRECLVDCELCETIYLATCDRILTGSVHLLVILFPRSHNMTQKVLREHSMLSHPPPPHLTAGTRKLCSSGARSSL